jgi:hypothetical protein
LFVNNDSTTPPTPEDAGKASPMLPEPYGSEYVVQDPGAVVADDQPLYGLLLAHAEHKADAERARELPTAPQGAADAVHWYAGQHDNASTSWFQLCLAAARTARGIPPVFPSARAAGEATPHDHRVTDPKDIEPGMVLYFWRDDPADVNGHIVTTAFDPGDHAGLEIPTWTNDALTRGGIDRVPGAWFPLHWGKPFRFAATSLNGYELDGAWNDLAKPKPAGGRPVDLIRDLREAHAALIVAARRAKQSDHDDLARLLDHDAAQIARRVARLAGAH